MNDRNGCNRLIKTIKIADMQWQESERKGCDGSNKRHMVQNIGQVLKDTISRGEVNLGERVYCVHVLDHNG